MTSLKIASSKAAMAIVAAAVTLTALTPAAFAAGPDRGGDGHRRDVQIHRDGGARLDGARGGLLALGCGPNAAERIEHSIVALSYRVNPTGEQVQLLDALKTTALDAQKELATTCDAVLPDRTADAAAPDTAARPNMLEAMQMRLKIDEARVAALGDVLPSFEAFFNSLTDEQKATLEFHGHRRGPGPDGDRQPGPAPEANRNS
jgi:hypothetical protein